MKQVLYLLILILISLLIAACDDETPCSTEITRPASASETSSSRDIVEYKALAERWAPVWYQDTNSADYQADYITRFDFDNDWYATNNWENLHPTERNDCTEYSLEAYIYYWVVETEEHWFVGYADFHPRDWNNILDGGHWEHENDLEGCLLVIKRDGGFGTLEKMVTQAHDDLKQYDAPSEINPSEIKRSEIKTEEVDGVEHPVVFVESKGHGVYGDPNDAYDDDWRPSILRWREKEKFPGGDGIIYRYTGTAEIPDREDNKAIKLPDGKRSRRSVGYALKSIDELWDLPDHPDVFSQFGHFAADNQRDGAKAPWGWDDINEDGRKYPAPSFFLFPAYLAEGDTGDYLGWSCGFQLPQPEMKNPQDQSVKVDIRTTLECEHVAHLPAGPDLFYYEFQIDEEDDFLTPIFTDAPGGTKGGKTGQGPDGTRGDTSYEIGADSERELAYGTRYYWRVRISDGITHGKWSEPCSSFRTTYGGIPGTHVAISEIGTGETSSWSFAIIADPHIGHSIYDYGTSGWNDEPFEGEDQGQSAQLLRTIVDDINERADEENIKFVIVLGDLTDSAEISELEKAKEILDGLRVKDPNGDYEPLYTPLPGNHDVWPYVPIHAAAFPGNCWNDDADSLRIRENDEATPEVTLYKDAWYGIDEEAQSLTDPCQIADLGDYGLPDNSSSISFTGECEIADLGDYEFHDNLSSIKVSEGTTAILYEHQNFAGDSIKVVGDETRVGHAPECVSDKKFNDIFAQQYDDLADFFGESWVKAPVPVVNIEAVPPHDSYFQNFAFDFGDYHFICLDFNCRDNAAEQWSHVGGDQWPGVAGGANLYDFNGGTFKWLRDHLDNYTRSDNGKHRIILVSHHPPTKLDTPWGQWNISVPDYHTLIDDYLLNNYQNDIDYWFAGHVHRSVEYDVKSLNLRRTLCRGIETDEAYCDNGEDYSEAGDYRIVHVFDTDQLDITAEGPVDISVTDPDSLVVSRDSGSNDIEETIPGATYIEADPNSTGDHENRVLIPDKKEGTYQLEVLPERDFDLDETFTLWLKLGNTTTILAEDIPVTQIPAQPPYQTYQIDTSSLTSIDFSMCLGGSSRPDPLTSAVDFSTYLQGSSNSDSAGSELPVDICFYEQGTMNLRHAFSGTAIRSEEFVNIDVHNIPPGTYDITVRSEQTLTSIKRDVIISEDSNSVDMGTLLEVDAEEDGEGGYAGVWSVIILAVLGFVLVLNVLATLIRDGRQRG